MNIIEIDVLDGRGLIQVTVQGFFEASRIREFMSAAEKSLDRLEELQIASRAHKSE